MPTATASGDWRFGRSSARSTAGRGWPCRPRRDRSASRSGARCRRSRPSSGRSTVLPVPLQLPVLGVGLPRWHAADGLDCVQASLPHDVHRRPRIGRGRLQSGERDGRGRDGAADGADLGALHGLARRRLRNGAPGRRPTAIQGTIELGGRDTAGGRRWLAPADPGHRHDGRAAPRPAAGSMSKTGEDRE